MKRILLLTVLSIMLGSLPALSQTLFYQDFEGGGDNWNYTVTPNAGEPDAIVWDIVSTLSGKSPSSGTKMWGAQDLYKNGTQIEYIITFAAKNISSYIGMQLTFDYLTIGYDLADYVNYEVFQGNTGSEISQGKKRFDQNTDIWRTVVHNIPDGTQSVYIKFYFFQDGTADYAMIDNIKLTGVASSSPMVTVSQNQFNFDNVYTGDFASESILYTVRGKNLTENIVITAPTGYEVSTSCGSGYASSISLTQSGGTITETNVYARFNPASYGTFSGNITHISSGVTKSIPVSETNVASNLPAGYYATAIGTGATLKTQLYNIINSHTVLTYASLWTHYQITDDNPNTHEVWDMYSDQPCGTADYYFQFIIDQQDATLQYSSEGLKYEREHAMPNSWWGGTLDPQYTDLFELYPADAYVNHKKLNFPFAEVSTSSGYVETSNGTRVGLSSITIPGYNGLTDSVYEPIDEYKGDFARTFFYLATCYETTIDSWEAMNARGDVMLSGDEYPCYEQWAIDMLIDWHLSDPVSQKEKNRNDNIYTIQGNRNPYIDNPNLVTLVWGAVGTSTLTAGTGAEPATISSLTDTQGEANLNLDFVFTDDGVTPATDAVETRFSQLVINLGTGNDAVLADWTHAIAGAELYDGSTTIAGTINPTNITFSGFTYSAPGDFGYIADDGNKTYTLKIWLKSSLGGTLSSTIDGKDFVFAVSNASFTMIDGYSKLAANQYVNSIDANNTVTVVATLLTITQQPSDENVNIAMTPAVTVTVSDANGNLDLDYTADVNINSTGTMTLEPLTGFLVNGTATFSNIIHSESGTGLTLTVSSGTLTDVVSSAFNITAPVSTISDIIPVAASESAIVPSNENTVGPLISTTGIKVWEFKIRDGGELGDADNFATIVNSIMITQNSGNSMNDWADAILACDLFNGSTWIASATIATTSLTFSGSPLISVPDNSSITLTLRLSVQLNANNSGSNLDGDDFVFNIISTNVTEDAAGSQFGTFVNTNSTNGMNVYDIVTTKLLFVQQPTNTGIGIAMAPNVTVEATDANGNRDLSFNGSVTLTSTGTMTGEPITVTAVSGLATFTGLVHTVSGTGYTMTATSTGLTDATTTTFNILDITILEPGDLIVVAVNTNFDNQPGVDPSQAGNAFEEFTFICFKDIKVGTAIDFTENGYERDFAGRWSGTEGTIRLTRTNGGVLTAGTSVTVIMNKASGGGKVAADFDIFVAGTDELALATPRWSITELNDDDGSGFDMNSADDLWIMQNGTWVENDISTDPTNQDDQYTGNILYGWTATGWNTNIGSTSPIWDTDGSRLYPFSDCFNTNVSTGLKNYLGAAATLEEKSKVKYVGPMTAATKYEWIGRVNNVANWVGYNASSGNNDKAYYESWDASGTPRPAYYYRQTGVTITITNGGFDAGVWTGGKNAEWFECANWQNLKVPTEVTNVQFGTAATQGSVIDATTAKAIEYGGIAECNDISISNQTLTIQASANNKLEAHGNLSISGTGVLDMDDANAGTEDGQIYLSGNWSNTVGAGSFLQGNSTIHLLGTGLQTIGTTEETFYNLLVNNTSVTGIRQDGNVIIDGTLTHTLAKHDLNAKNLTLNGPYVLTSGLFIGDVASDFTIAGTGALADIYFETDFNLDDFRMNRAATNANLKTDLFMDNDLIISAGSVTMNPGKFYDADHSLTNTVGPAGLILKSDATGTASLIHNNSDAVADAATVERYLTSNWHLIFSPLDKVNKTVFTLTSDGYTNNNFYWYDETDADYWDATLIYGTSGWSPESDLWLSKDSGYLFLSPVQKSYVMQGGYLFTDAKNYTVDYTNSGTGNVNLNGVTNDWDNFEGWNLVGNPYPCSVDWETVNNTLTNIQDGVYFYDDVNDKYVFYGGGTMINNGITINGTPTSNNSLIPSGQGFFVKANSDADGLTFSIPTAARAHSLQDFWKSEKQAEENLFRLYIASGDYTDEIVIRTLPNEFGVSDIYDNYDASKMFSWNKTKPQLFSTDFELNTFYTLNSLSEITTSKEVPLGIYIGESNFYSIVFSKNTFGNINVYLEDKTLNAMLNTRAIPSYSFTSETGTFTDRFVLHFKLNNSPVASEIEDVVIYQDENFEVDYSNVFSDSDLMDELSFTVEQLNGKQLPAWISNSGTSISGTPANEDVGIYSIRITATDLAGASASTDFTITVLNVNDAPHVVSEPSSKTVYEDLPFEFSIADVFADIDANDQLSYHVGVDGFCSLPSWIRFDYENLIIFGKTDNEDVGKYIIELTAYDNEIASAVTKFNFEIINVNDAPMVQIQASDYYTQIGSEFSIDLNDNTFVDIDENDVLEYSALLPSWINFNPFNLTFYGTAENEGTTEIKLTASDLAGESANEIFKIIVSAATSVIEGGDFRISIYPNPSNGIFTINCNSDKSYDFIITDISGKVIHLSALSNHNSTIDLSGYAAGVYYIEFNIGNETFKEKLIKL